MNKKLILLSLVVLTTLFVGGCKDKYKISDEKVKGIESNISKINDGYIEANEYIDLTDKIVEAEYESVRLDGETYDNYRESQKTIRVLTRGLNDLDLNTIKEYYHSKDNEKGYEELKNKYNQINRTIKYINGMTILKDNVVTDDEALDWICMREICRREKPFSNEIKYSDDYEQIVEDYGYSIIDKQNEFDEKYKVEDIN